MTEFLYHGWANGDLDGILTEGLDPPSYWGDLATAEGYAGPGGLVLRVPVERLEDAGLSFNKHLALAQFEEGEDVPTSGTWRDSLDAFGSVRCDGRLHVTEDDVVTVDQARLDEDGSRPSPGR